MTRAEVLQAAEKAVCGEREGQYGSPENNFGTIARLWTAYLHATGRNFFSEHDVAAMMVLLKVARVATAPDIASIDSWVDIAGYAACGCEVQTVAYYAGIAVD